MDWKSLTIPACLPITTDYFPDKRALHNDYLVSDYTLLPEGVNIDYAQNRAIYRRPLNTEEVFAELISQRLAQVTNKNSIMSNIIHIMQGHIYFSITHVVLSHNVRPPIITNLRRASN